MNGSPGSLVRRTDLWHNSNMEIFLQGTFFLLLLVFTVYSSFMAYHWYAYGTSKKTATEVLALYLVVAMMCFIAMTVVLI